jgi:hypothetical protein
MHHVNTFFYASTLRPDTIYLPAMTYIYPVIYALPL